MTDETLVQQFIKRSKTHQDDVFRVLMDKLKLTDQMEARALNVGYASPSDPQLVDIYQQICEQNPTADGMGTIDKEYLVLPYSQDYFTFLDMDDLTGSNNNHVPKLSRREHVYNAKALTGGYSDMGIQPVFVCFNAVDCLAYRTEQPSSIYVDYRDIDKLILYLNARNIEAPLILTYTEFGSTENRSAISTELIRMSRRIRKEAMMETVNVSTILEQNPTESHFIHMFRNRRGSVRASALRDRDEISKIVDSEIKLYRQQSAGLQIPKFKEFIYASGNRPKISTGLPNLDRALDGGLAVGLYLIGAPSGSGKTTMLNQIADHIARNTDVLFFTLEQSADELMSKSISRLTFQLHNQDLKEARSYNDIMYRSANWTDLERNSVEHAMTVYQNMVMDHLFYFEKRTDVRDDIEEGDEVVDEKTGKIRKLSAIEVLNRRRIGPLDIEYAIAKHRQFFPNDPLVVFLDYIQVLAPLDPKYSDKQNIDASVSQLRYIASQYNVPIVAISSLNRASMNTSPDTNALNGSGNLEYGADMVGILRTRDLSQNTTVSALDKNRKANDQMKKSKIRDMEFDIVKYRYGVCSKIYFTFYAQFSTFQQADDPGDEDTEEDVDGIVFQSRNRH